MSTSRLRGLGPSVPADPRAGVLVAALTAASLVAAGCQPAAQESADGEAAGGTESAAVSAEQAEQMERGLWEALSQGDFQGFYDKIADDATLVGSEGVVSKQDMMGMMEGSEMEAYELGDFQVMQPGSDVVMVTYRYSETFRPADADSAEDYAGWATSVWENRDGTWMTVFHQSSEAPSTE